VNRRKRQREPGGPADRHVVLIGLPGAGKTSIGRRLARLLQRPFADVDERLELTTGIAIPRLVRVHGDRERRRREGHVLADLLGRHATLVISAPGAMELVTESRELLARSATVLWIRGSLDLLAELSDPTHRPRLAHGHRESLTRLDATLAADYADAADLVVDIDPFHAADRGSLDNEPRHAIARHIAELLTTGDLAGTVPVPDDDLDPTVDHIIEYLTDDT
jgi:shikimate kinase